MTEIETRMKYMEPDGDGKKFANGLGWRVSSVFWGYLAQLISIQFFRFLYLKYFWKNLIYFTI